VQHPLPRLTCSIRCLASAARQQHDHIVGPDSGVDETEDSDAATRDRELAPCPPFACVPSIHFATLDHAKAGGAEAYYYDALGEWDSDLVVCQRADRTVIQLAGVGPCSDQIASVQFSLYYNGDRIRGFTESAAPYTVFGDDTKGGFSSRVLKAGGYSLAVIVRNAKGCRLWAPTFPFVVAPCASDAPTHEPTPEPTRQPSLDPTLIVAPSPNPSGVTYGQPTEDPTPALTVAPTNAPTENPTPL
jgi:hypothetical protein